MSREGIPGKEVADAGLMYGWSKAGPAKGGGCEQNSPKATMRGISAEPFSVSHSSGLQDKTPMSLLWGWGFLIGNAGRWAAVPGNLHIRRHSCLQCSPNTSVPSPGTMSPGCCMPLPLQGDF